MTVYVDEVSDEISERAQTILTSAIKSIVGQLSERFCNEEYSMEDHMVGSAMTFIKEAAQIALIMEIDKDEFAKTCEEVYNIVHLMTTDHAGSA
jgi:hypothetical protein